MASGKAPAERVVRLYSCDQCGQTSRMKPRVVSVERYLTPDGSESGEKRWVGEERALCTTCAPEAGD